MKLTRNGAAFAVLTLLASLFIAAQQPADLAGTWSGDATLEGANEPDTLVLVLELKDGKLVGHMTDQYQAIDAEITDIVLEQSTFSFSVSVLYGEGSQGTATFKMKVIENAMKGEFEIPEMGAKGTWQAAKKE